MRKMALTVSLFTLFLISVLPPIIIPTVSSNGVGWLDGWSYRKSHIIHPAAGAGTNYQVKIIVHYGYGTDVGANIYCNNRCRTDFGDIRFTDDDGITLLNYWMEKKTDFINATFWVKVVDNLSSNAATIYLYCGNSGAITTSNGTNTFLAWDDFDTGYTTGDLPKPDRGWNISSNSAGDICQTANTPGGSDDSLRYAEDGNGNATLILTMEWIQVPNCIIHFGFYYEERKNGVNFRILDKEDYRPWIDSRISSEDSWYQRWHHEGAWPWQDYHPAIRIQPDTWYKYDFICYPDGHELITKGALRIGNVLYSGDGFDFLTIFGAQDFRDEFFINNFYIRKYVSPEPSQGAWRNSWRMFRRDPVHTGYSESSGPEASKTLWHYRTGGSIRSSPAVVDDKVYVGSDDYYIYCLNSNGGRLIWKYQTGGFVKSSPAILEGRLYVGSGDDYVYCLNSSNGELIWRYKTGGDVDSSPCIVDYKVYIGSDDNWIYCLNASNGNLMWRYETNAFVESSPAVVGGRLYISSGPLDAHLYCLDAYNGSLIWKYLGPDGRSSPCVIDSKVYIGSQGSWLYCLDAFNGNLVWRTTLEGSVISSPSVVDGKVYAGSLNDRVCCLNASNGNLIWMHQTGMVSSSPAVAGGKIYIGSADGHIYCLGSSNGKLKWRYSTGGEVYSSPAIVDKRLYVGSFDGHVYCIGGSSEPSPPSFDFTLDARATLNVLLEVQCSQSMQVNVAGVSLPGAPPSGLRILGSAFRITANVSSGFRITINYYYADEELISLKLDQLYLGIYYWDEIGNSWVKLSTTVDAIGNIVRARVDHLTVFAVFGQPSEGSAGGLDWPFIVAGIAMTMIFVLIGLVLGVSRVRRPWIGPVAEPEILPTYEDEVAPEAPQEAPAPEEAKPETIEDVPPESRVLSEPVCSYCGRVNPTGSRYCVRCGRHLGEFQS